MDVSKLRIYRALYGVAIFFFSILFIFNSSAISIASENLVSSNAIGFIYVNMASGNKVLNELINRWANMPKYTAIKDLVRLLKPNYGLVAFYPTKDLKIQKYIVFLQCQENLVSNITVKKIIEKAIEKEKLEKAVWNSVTILGERLLFTESKKNTDLFYFINKNLLIFGTDLNEGKKIINIIKGKEKGLPYDPEYQLVKSKLKTTNFDIFLYLNGKNKLFSDTLSFYEKKWGMSLLLSREAVSGIGAVFNLKNINELTGQMIFKVSVLNKISDVIDDASFLSEAFKRKFSKERLLSQTKVTGSGAFVNLDFSLTGVQPLFLNLISEGLTSPLK